MKKSVSQRHKEQKEKARKALATLKQARKDAHAEFTQTTRSAKRKFNSRTLKWRKKLDAAGEVYSQARKPIDRSYYAAMRKADQLEAFARDLPETDPTREEAIVEAKTQAAAIRKNAEERRSTKLEPIVAAYQIVAQECEPKIAAEQAELDKVLEPAKRKWHEALEDAQAAYQAVMEPERPYQRRPYPEPLKSKNE